MNGITVGWAHPGEYGAMGEIWCACFGDSPDYVDFFFRHRLPSCRAVTARIGDMTVGAAYLLPAEMNDGGTWRQAYYVYAVGVLPDFRGRGAAAAMMRFIFAFAEQEDAICFLSPASPSLTEYYARLGMMPTHFAKWHRIALSSPADRYVFSPISAEEYAALRARHHRMHGAVRWDSDGIRYAFAENEFSDGFCLKLGDAALFGRREGDRLRIGEILPPGHPDSIPALCAHLGAADAIIRLPAEAAEADAFVLGMTYNMHTPANAPLGLLLD